LLRVRFKTFKIETFIKSYLNFSNMDPNLNRMSMGSRAGTSIKPKFGAQQGAVSRQGTAIKVKDF